MFKNYIKIALRNLIHHKTITLINIAGLAVGMACAILIIIWIQDELSYDQFHEKSDNIALVLRGDSQNLTAMTSKMLAPAIKRELPSVINATIVGDFTSVEPITLQYNEKSFEESWCLIDEEFFNIFSFEFIEGNPAAALKDPNSIILTKELAHKYFGNTNPTGQVLTMFLFGQKIPLKVTAVLENIPHNSHLQSQVFISINIMEKLGINWNNWDDQSLRTYVYIEKCDPVELAQSIFKTEKLNRLGADLQHLYYSILPLKKIHLYGSNIKFLYAKGDIKYVYIFVMVAIIILLIASVNYTNLTTALSLKRSKEIGIKKVIGADRMHIIQQFLGETCLLTIIALFFALGIVQLILPVFNKLVAKILIIPFSNIHFLIELALIVIFLSILAGLYPAMFSASYKPIRLLKSKLHIHTRNGSIRKGLVVFQFTLSIILIISTIIVFQQIMFFHESKLGYNEKNLVCVKLNAEVNNNYESFKNELLRKPGIISATRSEPVSDHSITRTSSVKWPMKDENQERYFWVIAVDEDFADTYQVEMLEGRFYSKEFATDRTDAYIVNKSAIKEIGYNEAINNELELWGQKRRIIGVVKDFHFSSFHNKIEPMIFRYPDKRWESIRYRLLTIRCQSGNLRANLKEIQNTWVSYFPDVPFNYYFLDDNLNVLYRAEEKMGELFQYFTLLAIFIACLGLYGLILFSTEQKIKEIGIRKVLGATVQNVCYLLSKEFIIMVIWANVIAWPIAWYAMNKWLQNFAYCIDISIWPFLLAGVATSLIALFTVSLQTVQAATANPVESLRYE